MKNQVKKSLSLIMAVLMLMSCWVWVAPEKAEAGAPNSYDVVVTTHKDNMNAAEITHRIVFTYADNTTETKNWANAANGVAGDETFTLSKWPKKMNFKIGSKNLAKARITKVTINGIEIFVGGNNLSVTGGLVFESTAEWNLEAGGTQTGQTSNWTAPAYANSVTTLTGAERTLAVINSGTNSTSTISISNITDQYGVTYTGSVPFSATLRVDEGINLGSNASITTSGNSRTITIKPWFQTLYTGKQSAKLYIDWSVNNGAKTGTETINVNFPTYTATFHANGGLIGDDSSSAKETVKITNERMNIGSFIGKAPAYAARTGFEFKGFYSRQNADATGKTASFSGTKFEDDKTKVPHTKGTGEDQYDTDDDFYGDTIWYAAWQALPITATFVTADNQLIGTVEGRYNNYMTASNMYNGDSGLNLAVKQAYDAITDKKTSISFNTTDHSPIYTDGSTTYTFAGWKIIKAYDESVVDGNEDTVLQGDVTFQATYVKGSSATYTVSFEDGNGGILTTQSGYKYRADVTNIPTTDPTKTQDDRYRYEFIGWAKDIGKNFYTVDEADKDENGATVAYTAKDGAEFIVKGDASYVPVFRMIPREYKVTYNYTEDNNTPASTVIEGYNWEDVPGMPEIKDNYTAGGYRYYLIGWKVNGTGDVKQLDDITVDGDIALTAVYGNEEAAKYTINFYGKAENGVTDVLLNGENNIYEHNKPVTAPEVPQKIDTEDALYTFAGWSPAVNTTASGDADYYATYTKQTYADIHFYNYDGTLIYETIGKDNSLFVDGVIPAYNGETPVKAEDVVGTYNFTGWADSQGNTVVPGTDTFAGDTYLYAQFETVYKDYTVKFVNEGETVTETKYHYGEEITVPADPTKASDPEFTYKFKFWSPDVSDICYGDATYTAVYERNFNYYAVTWLKDNKSVLSESNYKYNAKIQQAVVNAPVAYPDAGEGKTWAFKHWVQCDENGNDILVDGKQVIFQRGQRMPAEHLYFYPVFEEVDNILTVKFYKEDGTSYLGEAKVPYNSELAAYGEAFEEKAPKAADETYHYVINEWVNVDGGAAVTTITADVSVKATYAAEAHTKDVVDVTIEPTCTETGLADISCSEDACGYVFKNVVLDVIPDEGIPTGQFYVGADKWTLADFTAGIDYSDVKYVGPNTNVIVNAQDTGTRSIPWNVEGQISRGVGMIDYYVSEEALDPTTITEWNNIYNYEAIRADVLDEVLLSYGKTMQDYIAMSTPGNKDKKAIDDEVKAILASYNANATGILSNLNLVNGKEYIIYIRVSDREINGGSNVCYLSSGKLHYGNKAAEITVSGEGYGTKFCAEVDIRITDDADGLKVLLDGEEVQAYTNPGTTSANGTFVATFKTTEKGLHTVTVIDKNGNKTTKTFEIKGSHTYRNYTTAASCENEGSRYDLCTVCGAKANEIVLPAIGHSYTVNYIDKAPSCVVDGYRTYVCDNNCGTNLVLNPTDAAEKIAQAKKFVEPAEGEEEGTWVALTAADLADLKATGEHTYAKVKDENGEDTDEFVWVIDKEANCTVKGSKHRDCTVCGHIDARVTEEIPLDTNDGHKFYREKVTLEPTCTTEGEKTKTCRYCGHVELVNKIEALGHIAGEYDVTLEPTCTEAGSKILLCGRCEVAIGEPVKDDKGNVTGFDGKAVEIPATDHAWKFDGEIYEKDGKYYQDYVCKNDNTHTKSEEVEGYVPPVAATVTFDFNGGYYTIPAVGNPDQLDYVPEMLKGTQQINVNVGEFIAAAEVEDAFKLDNATKTYTFSHWEDAAGNAVKFPVEVKGDATYYAVYAEKFVNYTITYYKEDGTTEFKKTGYLHNGEEVELADGPSKAETTLVTYKFAGWEVIGSDPKVVLTDKATIDGANINLKATYTQVGKKYAVTYAYSKSNILETFEVDAGGEARACAITPVKKADSKYHYEFKAWNRAEQLAKVESNIYTTPDFEAALHSYKEADGGKIEVTTPATCTTNAVYTYTCDCGYSYSKEEPNTALGHEWGAPGYDEETGKNIVTCQREGCGVEETDTRSFTVKFYVNADDTQAIKTISYIPWGTTIDAIRLPADPAKESTATNDYTFAGWALKGDANNTIVDVKTLEIKQDYEFVAVFTATVRKYNVIFAYDAYNVIKTFTDVPAGSSVTFDGAVPTKACDENKHYTFSGWNGYEYKGHDLTVTNIQKELYITATFTGTKHTYSTFELEAATCTNGTGTRYWCDCNGNGKFDDKANGKFVDYFYDVTGKPLPHNFEEIGRKEATQQADGYVEYKCTACGTTERETLKYVDNVISIQVTVTVNGAAKSGVQVELQPEGGVSAFVTTNANGVANSKGTKGTAYTCYVTIDGEKVQVALSEDANGNLSGSYNHVDKDADCSCACHRNNIWGSIFRFFHKIIKLFTGEFKCCGNPDPMYG